jgi:hypothetical protein
MPRVPREKGPNDQQVTVNLPSSWVDEVDELAESLTRPGVSVTRADALRLAVRTGLDALRKDPSKGLPTSPEPHRKKR